MKLLRPCALLLMIVSASCTTRPVAPDRSTGSGHIVHVVMMWLNQPGDTAARNKLIQASYDFADLPGVVSIRAGEPAVVNGLATRPIDDTSFDVGVVMEFRDADAYLNYQNSPKHLTAVKEILKPLTKRVQVYTFTSGLIGTDTKN